LYGVVRAFGPPPIQSGPPTFAPYPGCNGTWSFSPADRARARACLPACSPRRRIGGMRAGDMSLDQPLGPPPILEPRAHQATPGQPGGAPPPPPRTRAAAAAAACLPSTHTIPYTPNAVRRQRGERRTQRNARDDAPGGKYLHTCVRVCMERERERERDTMGLYIYTYLSIYLYNGVPDKHLSHPGPHTGRQADIYIYTHTYIYIHVHTWVCVHMRPSLSPRPSPCPSTSLPSRARALRFRPTAPVNWRAPPPRAPPPLRHTAARRAPLPPNSAGQLAAPLPHHLPFPPFLLLLLLLLLALPSPCPALPCPAPTTPLPPAAGRARTCPPTHSTDRPTWPPRARALAGQSAAPPLRARRPLRPRPRGRARLVHPRPRPRPPSLHAYPPTSTGPQSCVQTFPCPKVIRGAAHRGPRLPRLPASHLPRPTGHPPSTSTGDGRASIEAIRAAGHVSCARAPAAVRPSRSRRHDPSPTGCRPSRWESTRRRCRPRLCPGEEVFPPPSARRCRTRWWEVVFQQI
jgi:hypothetical protein